MFENFCYSANMAFMTLSQVHAVERTSSLISTFLALGSIVVGLHHVWRHRVKKDTSAGQAVRNQTLDRSPGVYMMHVAA